MTIAVAPTQSNALKALRAFLLAALPSVEVIQAQPNRVPEPKVADFVTMTPLRRPRLATNVDSDEDVSITGSIAATVLTVSAVAFGTVRAGALIFGVGVAAATTVGAQIAGAPGGVGTYAVSPSQTLSSRALAAGSTLAAAPTEFVVQLDVHGPSSADNAQIISTLLRSAWGVDRFAESVAGVVPLYCEDPRQLPFTNDQQQVEDRWVVEAAMQVTETVSGLAQQYAGAVEVDVVSVEATYPPA